MRPETRIDARSLPCPSRFAVVSGLVLAAALLAGCRSTAPTKGKVAGDVYTSPHGNFSLPLPIDTKFGRRVQDDARDVQGKEGYLSVSDDFGELRSVEYAEIPAAGRASVEGAALPETLRAFYREAMVNLKAQQFPGLRSLHEEPVPDALAPAHFGVIFIPGGSTLVRGNMFGLPSGDRNDTVRAYLVFVRDGYIYCLGCATGRDAIDADVTLTPERLDGYKSTLADLRSRMRFPPLAPAPATR